MKEFIESFCCAVGGNHEASNYLWELYYGGWTAPNIYYLGHAGVINFGGARIAGLSGIYNSKHYRLVSPALHTGLQLRWLSRFCLKDNPSSVIKGHEHLSKPQQQVRAGKNR